jgi:integrase
MPPSTPLPGHTADHLNCPACEASRLKIIRPAEFGLLRFCDAGPFWLKEKSLAIAEHSVRDYQDYLKGLLQFFGELPLNEIHIGHIQEYQKWRQQPRALRGRVRSAGPSMINHEVNMLAQILDRAGLWFEIKRFYKPLRLPKSKVGRALDDEEARRLLMVAGSNPRWKVAFWGSLITANTTAGPGEILGLRLCDVDLDAKRPTITVRERLKNPHRERTIPLNRPALQAIESLLKRANRMGAVEPEHYLLPHRAPRLGEPADPTRPMGSWKKAWDSFRKKADLPTLRMYDLRHHVITRLLEDPQVSLREVMEIAGQVSKKMIERYSHIHLERKQLALDRNETVAPPLQLTFDNVIQFEQQMANLPKKTAKSEAGQVQKSK